MSKKKSKKSKNTKPTPRSLIPRLHSRGDVERDTCPHGHTRSEHGYREPASGRLRCKACEKTRHAAAYARRRAALGKKTKGNKGSRKSNKRKK